MSTNLPKPVRLELERIVRSRSEKAVIVDVGAATEELRLHFPLDEFPRDLLRDCVIRFAGQCGAAVRID